MRWGARIGVAILASLLVAWIASLLSGYDVVADVDPGRAGLPPGAAHWLGTDQLGRDFFSRLLFGLRNSLALALATTFVSALTGTAAGLLAAAAGRWVDMALSRLVDVIMAMPGLIFALMLLAVFGSGAVQLVLVIGLLDATRIFRICRALAMREAATDYVEAARLRGEGLAYVMTREILPNMKGPLLAEVGMRFSFVFLTIATLSFLGLGLPPPAADLGSLVRENASLLAYGDFTPLIPAAVVALLAMSVNVLLDGATAGEEGAP